MPLSLTCDVIDYHGDSGVADVAGDETPETLLPGRVPKLQAHLHEPVKVPRNSRKTDRREEREGEEEVVRGQKRTDRQTNGRKEEGARWRQGRQREQQVSPGTYL